MIFNMFQIFPLPFSFLSVVSVFFSLSFYSMFCNSCLLFFLIIFVSLPLCHPRFLPAHPQALLVRALLEYSQSSDGWLPYGLSLVAGIFLMELMRSWSLALMWAVNYRTATRLRGAALTFAFHKILRLRSTKDISPGEVGGITLEGTHLQIN